MELNEYQRLANQTDQQPETGNVEADPRSIMVPLLGLAGEVGELLGEHKKWIRDGDSYKMFPDRVKEELGDLLWYLSNVAAKHGLTLEDVATYNLDKTQRRWHPVTCSLVRPSLFDEGFPPTERFPRQMDVLIESSGPDRIVTFINGKKFGDPLRDNRYEDDGYRFHDIFHLSHASVLGWSPTLRALLRRKRKSDPRVDEVEDGGRAIVIEEGIAAMVFSYAERRNFLEGAEGVNYELLRTIKDMTSHLEVSCRTEGDWERAIMTGFQLWRHIRAKGKGRLWADLEKGIVELVW
jgi:NTP pyrophosphatase (non-canonical NTP hydrolase)